MAAFNQCTFVGNLTRDPQLSFTPNQTAVVDTGIAVNHKWTGSDGAAREEVCFLDVRAFAKCAENINKYMKKGSCLLLSGYLAFEQWEKDGAKHSRHRLIVERVVFLNNGIGHRQPGGSDLGPNEEIPF